MVLNAETERTKETLKYLKKRFPRAFKEDRPLHKNALAEFLLELQGEEPYSSNVSGALAYYQTRLAYLIRIVNRKWYRNIYGNKVCQIPQEDKNRAQRKLANIHRARIRKAEQDNDPLQEIASSNVLLKYNLSISKVKILNLSHEGIVVKIPEEDLFLYKNDKLKEWTRVYIHKLSDDSNPYILNSLFIRLCLKRLFLSYDEGEIYTIYACKRDLAAAYLCSLVQLQLLYSPTDEFEDY